LGRTPPLPLSGATVDVVDIGGLHKEALVIFSSLSQRRSSDVRPIDAKMIIKTIERSANNHPASDAVERFSDLSAMANWP
jgi:hypothetical protein